MKAAEKLALRREAVADAQGRCQRCGATDRGLIAHHLEYPEVETRATFVVVCRPCHHVIHSEAGAPRVPLSERLRFPVRVTVYTDDEGAEALAWLAERWEGSESAAFRRILREAVQREKRESGG